MKPLNHLLAASGPIGLLIVTIIVCGFIDMRILSPQNLLIVLTQNVPVLLLAFGAFVVLLTGGIDLTAGVAVTLTSIVIASLLLAGVALPWALAVGLASVVLIGVTNGIFVTVFGVPAFVTTLATMSCIQGLALLFATQGVYVLNVPSLKWLGTGWVAGVPVSLVVAGLVIVFAYIVMHRTRFGLRIYATGSDADATRLAGINTGRVLRNVYAFASLFTFLSAVMLIARTPIVTPNLGGQSLLLDGIAACVLGGTSIFGGRGTVIGVVAGTLVVGLFANALRVVGIDPASLDLMKGALIIMALVFDVGITNLKEKIVKENIG